VNRLRPWGPQTLAEPIPRPVFSHLSARGLAQGRSQTALTLKGLHVHHPLLGIRMHKTNPEFHRLGDLAREVLF
jgi:hypothetical protein